MAMPIFTKALPGLARSFTICLMPTDEHILKTRSWPTLFQVAGFWLRQYLQNIQMPITCGMVKAVKNDFEEAVVVVLTFKTGRPTQRVRNSAVASLLCAAGPPCEGFAVLGDWALIESCRELNRHAQRRFGLGDAFAVPANMDVCEASRVLYGLGNHQAFLEDSKAFMNTFIALAPTEPLLALQDAPECKHDWVGTTENCQACSQTDKTCCKCKSCHAIWCSACLSGQRTQTTNHEQALKLRNEARALLQEDWAREIHWHHQTETKSVYYVTDAVTTNEERAEWFLFELQKRKIDVDEEDLADVARLFCRFLGGHVKNSQQKTALKIFSLMGGTAFAAECHIRPLWAQEDFARVWDPDATLCHSCGGPMAGKICKSSQCQSGRGRVACAQCESTLFRTLSAVYGQCKTRLCENGHLVDSVYKACGSRHVRCGSPWPESVVIAPTTVVADRKRAPPHQK